MPTDLEKIYAEGYEAFDSGDYAKAIDLATKCIKEADTDSYWYAGALGLRCWAANFSGDHESVVCDAHALLALDSGDDKMWFDGLAAFNLALLRNRVGDIGKAEMLFDQARAKYQSYRINPKMPEHWHMVRELFEAVAHWASCGETEKIDDMAGRLSVYPDPSDEIKHLGKAADLYQRFAHGEDIKEDATKAAENGVSRAFLAFILLSQ